MSIYVSILFQSLKVLKTAEFMPFVVFIAAPGMDALKRMYEEGRRRGIVGRKGVCRFFYEFVHSLKV